MSASGPSGPLVLIFNYFLPVLWTEFFSSSEYICIYIYNTLSICAMEKMSS